MCRVSRSSQLSSADPLPYMALCKSHECTSRLCIAVDL